MMKIALKAKMTIGDTDITLKGEIPLLENDKDTDFVLTITASNAQESIPFDELLNRTSSAAVTLDKGKFDTRLGLDLCMEEANECDS